MQYTYKGNIYQFVEEGRYKHPETREWVNCVYYRGSDGILNAREKIEFYKLFKILTPKIPYHIEMMAKLWKTVRDENNIATGEIRKFIISEKHMKRGQRITSSEYNDGDTFCALWVHIASGYFKMIGMWATENLL